MSAESLLVQSQHRPTEEVFLRAWLFTLCSRDRKATRVSFCWHGGARSMALLAEEVREWETCPQGLANVVRPPKLCSVQLVWNVMPVVRLLASGWAAQGECPGTAVAWVYPTGISVAGTGAVYKVRWRFWLVRAAWCVSRTLYIQMVSNFVHF